MLPILRAAANVALPTHLNDPRDFLLGCIGIREDGVKVQSKNGAVEFSSTIKRHQRLPTSHAEGRVLRKLGKNGILYVARVAKKDGSLAMARPCSLCQIGIRSAKVKQVYYTIDSNHYGIWFVEKDFDKIIDCSDL